MPPGVCVSDGDDSDDDAVDVGDAGDPMAA